MKTEWTPEGQADQTPKSLGLQIIRRLRETFVVNKNEVFIGLGASRVNPLAVAALNLSPLARLPLWIWHSHGFLSREKKCIHLRPAKYLVPTPKNTVLSPRGLPKM